MRKFSSYGPIQTEYEYYAPRTELIQRTYDQLLGEQPGLCFAYARNTKRICRLFFP